MRFAIILFSFLLCSTSYAGLMEIGYSYSQMDSTIDDENFQKTQSHTGSFSWYFFEMSAIELSYTKGEGVISAKAFDDTTARLYRMDVELYGADLVITFAQKGSMLQPFIKGGAVWVDKKLYREDTSVSDGEQLISKTDKNDAVPSYGLGFKFYLLKHITLKASYDTWRSGKNGDTEIWDSAIRGGISFIF
jgi:hypothetical protein